MIKYYKTSGITCLQKHFDANHSTIYKRFPEEINNQRKKNVEKKSTKKRSHISNSFIFGFFVSKNPFKNDDMEQMMFVKNLALLIMKNHFPLQFVENAWLKHLVLQLCPHVHFHFQKIFSNIVLLELVEKIKEKYVLLLLNDCNCVIANFDLWMSKGAHDVFVLAINFWGFDWKPKHVAFGLFKMLKLHDEHWLKILLNF
jgi:hypothetical protein